MVNLSFRPATSEDAATLSALAFASKAQWGYSQEFMQSCFEDLTVTVEKLAAGIYIVAEQGGKTVGFYSLADTSKGYYLDNMFLSPGVIGQGLGRKMWQHAVETAKAQGWTYLLLDSEPHATGFYRAMGAEQVGEVESSVFRGRFLPLMRISL